MPQCEVCGCTDFYKASGYSFCSTCQTQNQDVGEELELELPMENNVKLRKTKIRRIRSDKDEEVGWTSWELYNFVLIGLTNELIELGVSADIKITVLQLWARYLGKLEIAFISKNKKLLPKLARRYKRRDAEIIYGKVLSQKRSKKRRKVRSNATDSAISIPLSEETSLRELNRNKQLMITADYDKFMESQMNSEGDTLSTFNQSVYSMQSSTHTQHAKQPFERICFNSFAKEETRKIKEMAKKIPRYKRTEYKQNHITTQYKTGPELITPMKLWAILYLALRIHNQDIHLSDMLRYGREGHLSYYKLDRLIPPEVALTRSDINFLSRAMDITHKGMRRIIGRMAKFLGVTKIICPDFLPLINRYCNELNLPRGILLYTERFVALSPPKMKFDKMSCIPNYEGRAMAFIIVVLKTLLSLDGITEYEISNVADKINSAINNESISDTKLFSFREWQKYIECRKTVLANVHYPTKLKYNLHIPDVNSLYVKFLEAINSKVDREEEPEIIANKHLISRKLVHTMKQCFTNISYIDLPINETNEFFPSLTAHHSYLQQLLEHPLYDLPNVLRNGFFSTKIGYMTKPEFLYKLVSHYNMQIHFIDSNLHFVEKTVKPFEQTKMASIKDLKDNTTIQDSLKEEIERKEDFMEYLHNKMSCCLKIDVKKRQYYDNICNPIVKVLPLASSDEFIFNEILPNGKLSIPMSDNVNDDENDNENDENDTCLKDIVSKETALSLSKFCKEYDMDLSSTEKRAIFKNFNQIKKQKRKIFRNARGKFIKQDNIENLEKDNSYTEESEIISRESFEITNILPNISDILNLSTNASIFDDFMKNEIEYDQLENSKEPVINDTTAFILDENLDDHTLKLLRPFKDYWMYHCNFSRVKPKNFELFEKMLPRSFRWLLNECASIIEMSTEDLYEEVCLIEAYYAYFSEQSTASNSSTENSNKAYINAILRKW